MNLNDIHSPADIKGLSIDELKKLAAMMREALLGKLSIRGGHVGPNLGMVEMTIAMHYVFDSPTDKIVFDVSHQCYAHKMLTGRMDAFTQPSHYGDVSGYTNPAESAHDFFTIGHTSTAVSLAGGLAVARDLRGDKENIIAVVGDGSLSGGEAFEGLDFAATLRSNMIVIVNDNDMSIAPNEGGIYANLRLLRKSDGSAELNFFKTMGFDYRYVSYGNDIATLIEVFESVKDIDHPVVLHICTQKGKGYAPAEAERERFHYTAPFDIATGNPRNIDENESYTDITADLLLDMMANDPTVAAITAGTPGAIGFTSEKRKAAGHQFIDVGIAEQEAVALASGMAKGGAKPCFCVVSSFLQRAYDQLSQDVSINRSPVSIPIFYGTMFGMNDVTHLGWFDIALVSNIPGFVYLAPTCKEEYVAMLRWSVKQNEYPVAVRVPGGNVVCSGMEFPSDYSDLNKYEVVRSGKDVAIIGAGAFFGLAQETADALSADGVGATVINPRFLSGLDMELLESLESNHRQVVTLEDGVLDGGFGEKIARFYGDKPMEIKCYGLKKEFADRYNASELAEAMRLRPELIASDVLKSLCKL